MFDVPRAMISHSTCFKRITTGLTRIALAIGPTAGAFEGAAAQSTSHRLAVGAGVIGSLLVGGTDDFLDGGYGVEGSIGYRPLPVRYVWLRADIGYIDLSEDRNALSGAAVDNNMFNLLVGPEVAYAIWRVEPFARAYMGLAVNRLSASAGSSRLNETDAVFAYGLGLGLRGLLARGRAPVSLELSGRLVDTGEVQFARSPDPGAPGAGSVGRNIAMLVLGLGARVELR